MKNSGFTSIKLATVAQNIVDQICKSIADGRYKPGDRLPTEPELAKMFSVGRNSVREAIKILEAYGILEIRRAEGTFITSGLSKSMVNPLIYGIILNSGNSRADMIEFQISIDKTVSRMCALKRTDSDLANLREAYLRLKESINKEPMDINEVYITDRRFHDIITESTHNEFMKIVNSAIWDLLGNVINEEILTIMLNEPSYMQEMHKNQYEAILSADEDAAAASVPSMYYIDKQNKS